VGSLLYSIGHASQDDAKSLDIERNANEPLELVDLKVSEHSVKSKIKVKHRNDDEGRAGLDKVEFQDQHDWFKRVRVRLRNVSGKPIIALQAFLYFQPTPAPDVFRVGLASSRRLSADESLAPGEEIEMTVDSGAWDRTVNILSRNGVDANLGSVTLALDLVAFSDGLQWSKGHFLHRDPNNSNRWIPIESKSPPGLSQLHQPTKFTTVAFKSNTTPLAGSLRESWNTLSPVPPQITYRCRTDGGYQAFDCSQSGCYSISHLANIAGRQSIVPLHDTASSCPTV